MSEATEAIIDTTEDETTEATVPTWFGDPEIGTPTQVAHRVRTAFRTALQALVGSGVTALLAWLAGHGLDLTSAAGDITLLASWIILGLLAALTAWVMGLPGVEAALQRFAPFLATGVHTETSGGDVADG